MKDQREYERARQRALKPSDRSLKRLFKPTKRPDGDTIGKGAGHSGKGRKQHLHAYAPNLRFDAWFAKNDLVLYDDDVVDDLRRRQASECIEDGGPVPRDRMHVSLGDLIKPERKRNGITRDYELIPRLRPVMIIEDLPSDDNLSSEEEDDWEVVPIPISTTPARLMKKLPTHRSYASVVSSSTTINTPFK